MAKLSNQLNKLDKLQQGELSRSRSASRRGTNFKFGKDSVSPIGKNIMNIKDFQSQGSVDSSSRRMLAKQRLFGAHHLQMSLEDLRLR